ncbi:hypothetical protein C8J56DRAFT_891363 [Mycena floridula]|nr:hypothetical protein C8J56DRAFT_891363 [Mycena floridula]
MTGEVIMALLRVWLGTLASEPKAWGTMQASRNNPSLAGTFKAVSQAWLNPRKGYLSLGCHIARQSKTWGVIARWSKAEMKQDNAFQSLDAALQGYLRLGSRLYKCR